MSEVRGGGREEIPHAPKLETRGDGREKLPTSPRPRPGAVAGRSNPPPRPGAATRGVTRSGGCAGAGGLRGAIPH